MTRISDSRDSQSATPLAFRQRWLFWTAFVLVLYIGSYVVLSANGTYRPRPSGMYRYRASGMALLDLSVWYPAGMNWHRHRSISGGYQTSADLPGLLYLPAITVDRQWIHPTCRYFDAPAK